MFQVRKEIDKQGLGKKICLPELRKQNFLQAENKSQNNKSRVISNYKMDEKKIQEMQILEQSLQNILLQKQAFQMELSETTTALKEIESADGDVFKIIGQLMIKTKKESIKKDLSEKKKILEMRLNSLDKQEDSLSKQLEKIRDEVLKK